MLNNLTLHFQGPVWVIAEHLDDIKYGNFTITGNPILCNSNGEFYARYIPYGTFCDKEVWRESIGEDYEDKDYDYFPRGFVSIEDGEASIHISECVKLDMVVNRICQFFNLDGLRLNLCVFDDYPENSYNGKIS